MSVWEYFKFNVTYGLRITNYRSALPSPKKTPPAPPKQEHIRVRNDSDIQLDGVLLDGDVCHTSPEGSNWSLSSVESSQSNRSQDNPPCFFQLPQDSSWEDCKGLQHFCSRRRHCSNSSQNHVAQSHTNNGYTYNPNNHTNTSNSLGNSESESGISVRTFEPAITAEDPVVHVSHPSASTYSSAGSSVLRTCSASSISSNGANESVFPPLLSSEPDVVRNLSSSSSRQSPLIMPDSSLEIENGVFHHKHVGRTSPVAVPGRVHRPESTSSASIGRSVNYLSSNVTT